MVSNSVFGQRRSLTVGHTIFKDILNSISAQFLIDLRRSLVLNAPVSTDVVVRKLKQLRTVRRLMTRLLSMAPTNTAFHLEVTKGEEMILLQCSGISMQGIPSPTSRAITFRYSSDINEAFASTLESLGPI